MNKDYLTQSHPYVSPRTDVQEVEAEAGFCISGGISTQAYEEESLDGFFN